MKKRSRLFLIARGAIAPAFLAGCAILALGTATARGISPEAAALTDDPRMYWTRPCRKRK